MMTLLFIGPGLALLIAYGMTRKDAQQGNAAMLLSKFILVLGLYFVVSGLIAARSIPPSPMMDAPAPTSEQLPPPAPPPS
jgi:predicted transporter